jgi:hypothetical protein
MIKFTSFNDKGLVAPVDNIGGSQFYVCSLNGSNQNRGTKDQPFATVDYAVGKCGTSLNDFIGVLPGHVETIDTSTDLVFDVAGITVQGFGNGTDMPTFTFSGGVSTDDINVDAKNITLKNLKFVSEIADLNVMFDVNEEYFSMEDCILSSGASVSGVINFVNLATTKDNFKFKNTQFINPVDPEGTDAAANTGALYFVDSENIFVENCFFNGYFETSLFHNKTTAAKNVWTKVCSGIQLLSGAEIFTQVATMSGGDMGSMFIVRGASGVTEGETWGTLSANFFVSLTSCVGNDGSGGQVGVSGGSIAS